MRILAVILPLLFIAGCGSLATKTKFYEPIAAELQAGKAENSAALLEEAYHKNKFAEKDRFLYYIDAGLLYHYADSFQTSNERLHQAEIAAEELVTKSVSRGALSMALNENVLEYGGEDYEILYANLIKALNYMALDDFDEAFVEIRRANLKLELLQQKYADAATTLQNEAAKDTNNVNIEYKADSIRFHNDAFGRYLSMHMYAADGKFDDARIDYDYLSAAFQTQAHIYDFTPPDVRYRSDSAAILSIVGLAGLAPVKDDLSLRIRTDKDLKLVQILYDDPQHEGQEYGHLPLNVKEDYYFKFAIPQLVTRPSAVSSVRVVINGNEMGHLQLLEDVNRVALETFEAKKTLIYLRSLARAIAKGLAAHRMKEKQDTGGLGGWLKKAAIDVGMDFLENADLRCSRFLPGYVYVGDFELEPGSYDVVIEYLDPSQNILERKEIRNYQVLEKGLNMLSAYSAQ